MKPVKYRISHSYDKDQLSQIKAGLVQDIDVGFYEFPIFDWKQMREIRLGLIFRLDVRRYNNAALSYEDMREIRMAMCKQKWLDDKHMDFYTWVEVARMLRHGPDETILEQIDVPISMFMTIKEHLVLRCQNKKCLITDIMNCSFTEEQIWLMRNDEVDQIYPGLTDLNYYV